MRLRRAVAVFAAAVIVIVGCVLLSVQAQTYRVFFIGESLTMSPASASEGTRVTFTFRVDNKGEVIRQVQIRVVEPCNGRGEGRVLVDVTGKVINRGINTFSVSGRFQAPSGDKNSVLIELLDRRTSTVPAPVITHSGTRPLTPASYKLTPYTPLI